MRISDSIHTPRANSNHEEAVCTMDRTVFFWFVIIELILPSHCTVQRFSLPEASRIFRADSQGRTFVAAGNRLFRLNRDLVLQETVNLPNPAVDIDIETVAERLVVCSQISCTIFNTNNLNNIIATRGFPLGNRDYVNVFTAGYTFYLTNITLPFGGNDGTIILRQYGYSEANTFLRSQQFHITAANLNRKIYRGLLSGNYTYFIVFDHTPYALKVMRVCHASGCAGVSRCSFQALYEETFTCGGDPSNDENDRICDVSLVENFAGTSGASIVISKCRPQDILDNAVCVIKIADIDATMDRRYNECTAAWGQVQFPWRRVGHTCSDFQVNKYRLHTGISRPNRNKGLFMVYNLSFN